MPKNDTIGLTATEKKRILSFSDFVYKLNRKIYDECERKGIQPEDFPICADLSAVVGSIEYFIQEHINLDED